MVNINIQIPDDLHKQVKIQCAIDEVTLKEYVIKAIEEKAGSGKSDMHP